MNEQFTALGMLLPSTAMSRTDRASVVMGAINYIAALQVEMARLERIAAATTFSANGGLICVDHTGDPNSLTAVTTLPAPGTNSNSSLASFLGTNVTISVCVQNCFITISSPQSRSGLLEQIFVTIIGHDLEVLCASTTARDNTVVYCIQCQGSRNAELLSNNLHTALQSVVNDFIRN